MAIVNTNTLIGDRSSPSILNLELATNTRTAVFVLPELEAAIYKVTVSAVAGDPSNYSAVYYVRQQASVASVSIVTDLATTPYDWILLTATGVVIYVEQRSGSTADVKVYIERVG